MPLILFILLKFISYYIRWKAAVIRRDNPHRALIFYRDLLDQQTENQVPSFARSHILCP